MNISLNDDDAADEIKIKTVLLSPFQLLQISEVSSRKYELSFCLNCFKTGVTI